MSWVYSVEWPIFAVLAVLGRWHLVHEDPDSYRARRWRSAGDDPHSTEAPESILPVDVEAVTATWAALLTAGVAVELLVGIAALVLVPFGRPSGWIPTRGAAVYGSTHRSGSSSGWALAFLVRVRRFGRIARISGWTGAVCLVLAGVGGVMTEPDSAVGFMGVDDQPPAASPLPT